MKRQLLRALTPWNDDRGMALPLALMALMVLGALSAALLTMGGSEVQISYNHLRSTQAQFMAEAGMEDAFNYFRSDTSRLPPIKKTVSDTCIWNTSDPAKPDSFSGCAWNDITSSLSGPGTAALQDYGSYTVEYRFLGPNTVLVKSTGTSKIGSGQKVLRAIITNGFASDDAVRTQGSLDSAGTALTVSGTCGSVHTNTNYTKSGSANPTFSEGLTATGTAAAGTRVTGGKPKKLIPAVKASDFWGAAKIFAPTLSFEYKTDGTVVDGNGAPKFTYTPASGTGKAKVAAVDTYRGWKWNPAVGANPAEWTLDNASQAGGATYYFNQNVNFNGGNMQATILATGDITIGGNFTLTPHLTATLLVSDKDIDMSGTAAGGSDSTAQGLIAAHEQIELGGNVTITGNILAEDGAVDSSTVTSNSIGGSVTITYDCDQGPPIKGPVRYLAWGF